ncbi:MAG: hypothetical protein WC312_02875 [Candidatus Omnitrophota bacterium]|jgi:hypothetical protein
MKKIFKTIGKIFVILNKTEEGRIRQRVLLVDGKSLLPNNFALIIKGVKEKFRNADLVILAFEDKEDFLRENFPGADIIVPGDNGRYRLAIKLFSLLRRRYAYIILSSLDISLVFISVFFGRRQVLLFNRWFEWYRVRRKTLMDIILRAQSADKNHRKTNRGLKDVIKSAGRAFIILSNLREGDTRTRVLVADDGRGELGYITTAVKKAKANFINPDISVITFPGREHYFTAIVPAERIITVNYPERKFSLAAQIYSARKAGFSRIVLTNLDIAPISICLLFMRGEIFLYNKWHEWWTLGFRSIYGYLRAVPRFLYSIFIFTYLLTVCVYILLKTALRLFSGSVYNRRKASER